MKKIIHASSPFLFSFLISLLPVLLFTSCKTYHRNSTHNDVSLSSIEKGAELAKTYCRTCHQLPDPSLLDSKSWEKGVLPEMGPRLGIFNYGFETYPVVNDENLGKDFYPSHPLLSSTEWQNILDYYDATSPDSLLPQKKSSPIQIGLPLFEIEMPDVHYTNAATCYAKINPTDSAHPIVIDDALKQNLYLINPDLRITDSVTGTGSVVDIDYLKNQLLVCDIGKLNPNNGKYGEIYFVNVTHNGSLQKDTTLTIDNLQRPVQVVAADLNKDGKTDFIVCEFGFMTGELSWFENVGNNKFQKHVIRNIPGSNKSLFTGL